MTGDAGARPPLTISVITADDTALDAALTHMPRPSGTCCRCGGERRTPAQSSGAVVFDVDNPELDKIAPGEGINVLSLVVQLGINAVKTRLALIAASRPRMLRRVPESRRKAMWLTTPR